MNKGLKIIISTIILAIVLIAGLVFYVVKKPGSKLAGDDNLSGSATALELATNPINGQVIGEKMPKTNPFQVKISPFDAYQNPFKK